MKKQQSHLIVTIIVCLVCVSTISIMTSSASVISASIVPKLLIIVADMDNFDRSIIVEHEGSYDVMDGRNIDYSSITAYSAYVVAGRLASTDAKLCAKLRNAYNRFNSRVYLHGDITITDYKQTLAINKFGAYTDIYDDSGITLDKVYISFSEEQENTFVENIISSSGSQSDQYLIASVTSDNGRSQEVNNIVIILDDYLRTQIIPMATIVKSGYNFRSYYNTDNYINMDYLLYKDNDETDPTYDYFAVKTNLCTENDSVCDTESIDAKHCLPFSSDEMIDYGPGDITRAGSVSVNLDLGGINGLSYSFEVGGGPTINATYSAANDYCTWDIVRYWFLGDSLENNLFCLGSSWASTGTYAGTNIDFRAEFKAGPGYVFYTPWKYVQIRYNY
jgi:hypothetical protein